MVSYSVERTSFIP